MIYYLIYSISFLGFWSLLLLGGNEPISFGIFTGLVYTFYSSFIIRSFVQQETRKLIIVKFIGPVFFLVLFFNAQVFNLTTFLYTFISPISIAFLLFCLSTFSKNNYPKKEVQFFVLSLMLLYSFSIHDKWDKAMVQEIKSKRSSFSTPYDFEVKKNNFKTPNLSHYQFLNSNLDSIKLSEKDKYTIIETWNEKCIPCFKAMEDMKEFYKSIASKINQYYVYIPTTNNLDYSKIFSFNKIENKSNILVDINLQKDAQLKGYPIFLVFGKEGKLAFKQIGYNSANKEKLKKDILAVLN